MNYDKVYELPDGTMSSKYMPVWKLVKNNRKSSFLTAYQPNFYCLKRDTKSFDAHLNDDPKEPTLNQLHYNILSGYIAKWTALTIKNKMNPIINNKLIELINSAEYIRLNSCGIYLDYHYFDDYVSGVIPLLSTQANRDNTIISTLDRDINVTCKLLDYWREVNETFEFKTKEDSANFDKEMVSILHTVTSYKPAQLIKLPDNIDLIEDYHSRSQYNTDYTSLMGYTSNLHEQIKNVDYSDPKYRETQTAKVFRID